MDSNLLRFLRHSAISASMFAVAVYVPSGVVAPILICLSLMTQTLAAQSVHVSPIPLWPLDGARTGASAAHNVFLNPETSELIVVLPDANTPAGERVLRYGDPSWVRASLSAHIAPSGSGVLRYVYTVTERPGSRQRVGRVRLLLPELDAQLVPDQSGWPASFTATTQLDIASLAANSKLRLLTWTNSAGPAAIPGGGVLLVITSRFLPGFTDALIQGQVAHELTEEEVKSFPEPVAAAARRAMEIEWRSEGHVVMAPLFRAGTPKEVIAGNYHFGMSRMMVSGALKKESVFVSTVLTFLTGFLQHSPGMAAPSQLGAIATSPLEQEIAAALDLAFRQ